MNTNDIRAHLPAPTQDSKPFWAACNAGRLDLQHCTACGTCFYFPRRLCPSCGASDLRWQTVSGRARLYSFSEIHVSFYGPDWGEQLPYTVGLIDLEEGPRMLSRFVGTDAQSLRIGECVEIVFVEVDGQKLPFFQRASASTRNKNTLT